jgi:hypothetical protein
MTSQTQACAARYREQATQFREMASAGQDEKLDHDLLELAKQYDALANRLCEPDED